MNKNLIIGLALVLLVGGGAYMMMNKQPASPNTTNPTTTPEKTASSQKSLKDLLLSGISQKCTFKDKMAEVNTSGTTYLSGGKMRGDFNSTTAGKTMMMHMIVNDKTSYVWTEGQNTGFKMSFDMEKMSADAKTNTGQNVDVNKMIDYNCSPWVADNSMFMAPASVKFNDYGTITMPSGTPEKMMPSSNPYGCSACDSLSGDAKTQCKTALKCN